jgi:uroporphyrinogen III methyltransferase/synthase
MNLAGRRIVVTRPDAQAEELCERLRDLGAVPVRLPTIDVLPAESCAELDRALSVLHEWDWVVFTSANGVRFVFDRCAESNIAADKWRLVSVAAIGPATTAALAERGVHPAAVPEEYLAERIAEEVGELCGRRFLLLRADIASDVLPRKLRAGGAYVEEVVAYRTRPRGPDPEAALVLGGGADAITFTSPSTVRGLRGMLGERWRVALGKAAVISIGPVTSAAARELGLTVDAEASEHTVDGLLTALTGYFDSDTHHEVSR